MIKRCPITYGEISDTELYSKEGLKLLSPKLTALKALTYSSLEQRQLSLDYANKLSIQGVQPKLSAVLDIKHQQFKITANNGKFIIKPSPELYPEAPENEDLSMRLAASIGIEVPLHGLLYCKDNTMSYFIKRFDRYSHNKKISVEDFAQLTQQSRETKYNYSMEKLILVLEQYCSFPAIDKNELFLRTIFNFLIGNEDMHLKNFSLITKNNKVQLSPAYDLINSSILIKNPKEQIALPLNGRKNNLRRKDFINYFAYEKLQLNEVIVKKQLDKILKVIPSWPKLINVSFLSSSMQKAYLEILDKRINLIF